MQPGHRHCSFECLILLQGIVKQFCVACSPFTARDWTGKGLQIKEGKKRDLACFFLVARPSLFFLHL